MEERVRCSADVGQRIGIKGRSTQLRGSRVVAWVLSLLVALITAQAWATSYVYDTNGRLTAVTNDAGESARYVYDVMGNLQKVDRLAVGELALFGFTPARGVSGMQVRIQGQGFSAEPGANAVNFSGVAASVLRASKNDLEVIVPIGAVTGPVAVTVGAQTAVSHADFIVEQTVRTPRIDSISPQAVNAGNTVTVTGESCTLRPIRPQCEWGHAQPLWVPRGTRCWTLSCRWPRPAVRSLSPPLTVWRSASRI